MDSQPLASPSGRVLGSQRGITGIGYVLRAQQKANRRRFSNTQTRRSREYVAEKVLEERSEGKVSGPYEVPSYWNLQSVVLPAQWQEEPDKHQPSSTFGLKKPRLP